MKIEDALLDLVQRMARLEEKVDAMIETQRERRGTRAQTYLSLLGSATAIGIAVFL